MEKKKNTENLINEFVKAKNGYSDQWCILCGKPFRISNKLDQKKEKHNICLSCWLYHKR